MLAGKVAIRRGFAAAATQAQSAPLTSQIEEKFSRLSNGITVASVDLHGAVSSLVLAYRAGSRYLQPDESGLVHHLRNNFGKDSEKYLGVKLLWQLGSIGGNLNSYATKDLVAVHTNVIRDRSVIAISLLGEFSRPAFCPWDVEDAAENVVKDLKFQEPYDAVLELLHKAAYRNGSLANPILAQSYEADHACHKKLSKYSNSRLLTSEAVLFGVNVNHDDLVNYASQQSVIGEGKAQGATASPYKGGDARLAGPSSIAHVLIGGEGAAVSDSKAVATQAVLAALIGSQPGLKFTNSVSSSVVGAAVRKASNHRPVGVAAVNVSHSDSGLVGVYYAEPTVRAAFDGLKQVAGGVEKDVFEAAQKSAQLETLLRFEQTNDLALEQARQSLLKGELLLPTEFAKQIGQVTVEDVKKAAQKIVSKPSIAAYGRINQVPYVDQL
ncbi:Cytochrome b-c1 complex subunit 2, mitochondrial [Aphelenchoides bicaudatus]|nr:Cytochrome b-c1 complex subunit 2, mitochondrial [Aphelenchoides bicaudatus]